MHIVNEIPPLSFFKATMHKTRARNRRQKVKSMWLRTRLAEAQNWRCCWCGCVTTEESYKKNSATLEHLLPKSRGGQDKRKNLVIACYECNTRRQTTRLSVFYKMFKGVTE